VLGDRPIRAFVRTTSLEEARGFYEGVLGLDVVQEDPYFCILDAGGARVHLVLVDELQPIPGTVVGWTVDDIAATVPTLEARGVTFIRYDELDQDDLGVWTALGGDRVAWFQDPDGNTLSLTQPANE
jgi:catechol 2,3-dioxygenase-like lactoylglutathione lyase family enzyme